MSLGKYLIKVLLGIFSHLPSGVKICIYRLLGAKIKKDVELGFGSFILQTGYDFKKIEIGNNVKIGDGVRILAQRISLGEGSQIRDNTRIWGQSGFVMGKAAYIDQGCFFDLRNDIILGDFAGVGGGSWLYTHGVFHSVLDGTPYRFGPIHIGEKTWVAANVFIMPGITIGRDALVESRSFVTRDVLADTVVSGHPAVEITKTSKITRTLSRGDKQWIVRNVLRDFVRVYRDVTILTKDNPDEMEIRYKARLIRYLIQNNNKNCTDIFEGSYRKPLIIAFGVPDEIKRKWDKNDILWFDLESRSRSGAHDSLANILARFFENFGIGLEIWED